MTAAAGAPPRSDTAAGEGRGSRPTSTAAVLAVVVTLTFTVPAAVVLAGPLRSIGWPPRLLSLLLLAVWLTALVLGRVPRANATVWAILGWGTVLLLTFGLAFTRPLAEAESGGAVRALLAMAGVLGLALVTSTLVTRRDVDVVVAAVVLVGGGAAVLGLIQSQLPIDPANWIAVGPLVLAGPDIGLGTRGDFVRVVGTSWHAIEFGVLMACLVPLALYKSLAADTPRRARLYRFAALAMAAVIPFTVSRSGILALLVAMVIYTWPWTLRRKVSGLVVVLVLLPLFRIAVPGLIGTLRYLFTATGEDPSIQGRQDDYPLVAQFVSESPWVGRGLGTFRPEAYFFVDNHYFVFAVETGAIGLAAFALVVTTAVLGMYTAGSRAVAEADRALPRAIAAGIVALVIAMAVFDLFSFGQVSLLFGLLLGLAAAVARLPFSPERRDVGVLSRIRTGRRHGLGAHRRPRPHVEVPPERVGGGGGVGDVGAPGR